MWTTCGHEALRTCSKKSPLLSSRKGMRNCDVTVSGGLIVICGGSTPCLWPPNGVRVSEVRRIDLWASTDMGLTFNHSYLQSHCSHRNNALHNSKMAGRQIRSASVTCVEDHRHRRLLNSKTHPPQTCWTLTNEE